MDLARLTEREKAALRLLAHGHDGKSATAALGVSVHAVNERLREARVALGVTSSRAAARVLSKPSGPRKFVPTFRGWRAALPDG